MTLVITFRRRRTFLRGTDTPSFKIDTNFVDSGLKIKPPQISGFITYFIFFSFSGDGLTNIFKNEIQTSQYSHI